LLITFVELLIVNVKYINVIWSVVFLVIVTFIFYAEVILTSVEIDVGSLSQRGNEGAQKSFDGELQDVVETRHVPVLLKRVVHRCDISRLRVI
jgi:hypothetical protein